jgi:predicted transcriptional regulator
MDVIAIKPERKAQLEEYAQCHGQDAAAALDNVLAGYLEWERQDYAESVAAIQRGNEDVKAGRTRPAAEFLEELREKHGFPPKAVWSG